MPNKKLIYLLDDNLEYLDMLTQYIGDRYECKTFHCHTQFKEECILIQTPDFAILDIHLHENNIFDICDFNFSFPFVLITGYGSEKYHLNAKKVKSQRLFTKPFPIEELIWEINNYFILNERRNQHFPIKIDFTSSKCEANNKSIIITKKEIGIITFLQEHFPHPINRNSLIEKIWSDTSISEKTLYSHLYNLREKLFKIDITLAYKKNNIYLLNNNNIN